jgi:hypothetical protein
MHDDLQQYLTREIARLRDVTPDAVTIFLDTFRERIVAVISFRDTVAVYFADAGSDDDDFCFVDHSDAQSDDSADHMRIALAPFMDA